eukprot:13517191-Heterocapsa_arctica.AAC.1
MNAKRARRKATKADRMAELQVFGYLVGADNLVSNNEVSAGIDDEKFGMVNLDHATKHGWEFILPAIHLRMKPPSKGFRVPGKRSR